MRRILFATLTLVSIAFGVSAEAATLKTPSTISTGLIGWWTFDGSDVTSGKMIDRSGTGNTGTFSGIASTTFYATGKIGQMGNFDGADDYVSLSDSGLPSGAAARSVSMWMKAPVASWPLNTFQVGLHYGNPSTNTQYYVGGYYGTDCTGTLANTGGNFSVVAGTGGTGSNVCAATSIADGQWHHVVATYNGATHSIYLDGTLQSSRSQTPSTTLVGSGGLKINYTSSRFVGGIDDVRIYNRALTATEVATLYRFGAATFSSPSRTGLVGHWTFDDATSTTAGDSSGKGNHGTLTNMDATTDWVTGKFGKALDFDGVNDYVSVNGVGDSDPDTLTVSVWAKTNSDSAQVIYGHRSEATRLIQVAAQSASEARFQFRSSGNSLQEISASVDMTKWNHFVAILDVPNNLHRFYVNGVLVGTNTTAFGSQTFTSTRQSVGATFTTLYQNFFNGYIDDVRVYNRALGVAEITSLYRTGPVQIGTTPRATGATGLVGHWTFDGADVNWGTGRVTDRSGSGNTGTLVGMATSTSVALGVIGQGGNFGGSADYVSIASSPITTTTGDWTIATWMNPSNLNQNGFMFYNAKGGIGMAIAGTGSVDSAGSRLRGVFDGVVWLNTSYFFASANTWYHVAMRRSSGTTQFLVNGVVVATFGSSPNSTTYGTSHIGGGGGTRNFSGLIDDTRVYTRALSDSEIYNLYNMGR